LTIDCSIIVERKTGIPIISLFTVIPSCHASDERPLKNIPQQTDQCFANRNSGYSFVYCNLHILKMSRTNSYNFSLNGFLPERIQAGMEKYLNNRIRYNESKDNIGLV